MIRSRKRSVPVSWKSIANYFVRSESENVNDSVTLLSVQVSDPVSLPVAPPAKRIKQRTSGFDPSWKEDFPWVKEVDGGIIIPNYFQFFYIIS